MNQPSTAAPTAGAPQGAGAPAASPSATPNSTQQPNTAAPAETLRTRMERRVDEMRAQAEQGAPSSAATPAPDVVTDGEPGAEGDESTATEAGEGVEGADGNGKPPPVWVQKRLGEYAEQVKGLKAQMGNQAVTHQVEVRKYQEVIKQYEAHNQRYFDLLSQHGLVDDAAEEVAYGRGEIALSKRESELAEAARKQQQEAAEGERREAARLSIASEITKASETTGGAISFEEIRDAIRNDLDAQRQRGVEHPRMMHPSVVVKRLTAARIEQAKKLTKSSPAQPPAPHSAGGVTAGAAHRYPHTREGMAAKAKAIIDQYGGVPER